MSIPTNDQYVYLDDLRRLGVGPYYARGLIARSQQRDAEGRLYLTRDEADEAIEILSNAGTLPGGWDRVGRLDDEADIGGGVR